MPNFKVVLIVNSIMGTTYGINIIAAQLKKLGVGVIVLYLAETERRAYTQADMTERRDAAGCLEFSAPVVEQVIDLCSGASLVGFSMMTSGFFNAVQLTTAIRRSLGDIPVIWGGKHTTIAPEECLQHADVICIGEGEISTLEYVHSLITGKIVSKIDGLWFKDGDRRSEASYVEDLDKLPFPDYGPKGHYLLAGGIVRECTHEDIQKYLLQQYPTMIARGCPMKCTFCTNSGENNRRLRTRSVDNVIDEILKVTTDFGPIRMVMFRDDTIMSLKLEYFMEFSRRWKEKVNIPFSSSGVIPTAVSEEKLRLLIEAGFFSVKMGIQSGSVKVRQSVYHRPESDDQILRAANLFRKMKIPHVGYMFITDSPWETEKEIITSLRFIPRLPRPFSLSMYSLNLYPGTLLFSRAMEEGMIKDPHEWYNKSTMTLKMNYFNMLYMMQRFWAVPGWIMTLLTTKSLYRNKFYQSLFTKLYGWYFRNLSEFGVERRPVRPTTFLRKAFGLFLDIARLDFRRAAGKISKAFRLVVA